MNLKNSQCYKDFPITKKQPIVMDRSILNVPIDEEQQIVTGMIKDRNIYTVNYLNELRDACHLTDKYLTRYQETPLIDKRAKRNYEQRIGIMIQNFDPFE